VQFRQLVVVLQAVQFEGQSMQLFCAEACTGVAPPDVPEEADEVGTKKISRIACGAGGST